MTEDVISAELKNKVVAITGGSAGIGKAIAEEYLKNGCKVAICSRSEKKLRRMKEENNTENLLCFKADVSIPQELEAFAQAITENFKELDIWYNNAGMGIRKPLLQLSLEEWDSVLNLNLRAVFTGGCLAARLMRHGGVIVNTSSFDMRLPLAGNGPYSASKWGVEALTRIMAAEFAPRNIRVFSFAPSIIETDLTRERVENRREWYASQTVLNRVGQPVDLAPLLVLLTTSAASYLTGTTIEISGGKFCVQNPDFAWKTLS